MTNFLIWAAKFKMQLIAGAAVLVALVIAVGAAHQIGYNKGLNVSEVEINRYKGAVAILAERLVKEQGKVTTKIQTEYLDRVVERQRIVYVNRDVIVDRVPEQFVLSQGWVYAHDQAALGREIDPDIAANAFPSDFSDRTVLQLVADNYGKVCLANADQLESLQTWIRGQQKANEEVNSNR